MKNPEFSILVSLTGVSFNQAALLLAGTPPTGLPSFKYSELLPPTAEHSAREDVFL